MIARDLLGCSGQWGFAPINRVYSTLRQCPVSTESRSRAPTVRERKPLVRQAKLGVSCRVKDPVRTRPNQPFVPSVAVMKEDAKFGSRSDRRIEKISALKKGRQRLQRAWKSCECDGKTGTQTSAVSDRTTSLKRTQGTT